MDWLGIGVLIIGIAFAVLVVILIKPLNKLTTILDGVQKTTEKLPQVVDESATQANEAFGKVNDMLSDVNKQVESINPVFHIVKDTGEAAQHFTSVALEKTMAMKKQTTEVQELATRKKYKGLYGVLSLIFAITQRKKELQNVLTSPKNQ